VAGHEARHGHSEVVPGPSGEASVVLDIGGDRGAVVLFTPPVLEGEEIELRPVGQPWDGTHTAVRRRELQSVTRYAGVFGSVVAGHYEARLRGVDDDTVVPVSVIGGTVSEVTWPGPPVGARGISTSAAGGARR
jgi:hypothetical protein